jgi:hypothetical protein
VLRPGGTLVLGTPDYSRRLWLLLEWIYGKVLPGAYAHEHITHYTAAGLAARLAELGYEVQDCQYVGFCEMIFKARKPAPAIVTQQSIEAGSITIGARDATGEAMRLNPETTS